ARDRRAAGGAGPRRAPRASASPVSGSRGGNRGPADRRIKERVELARLGEGASPLLWIPELDRLACADDDDLAVGLQAGERAQRFVDEHAVALVQLDGLG